MVAFFSVIFFMVSLGFAEKLREEHGFGFWQSIHEGLGWPWWFGNFICSHYIKAKENEQK